MFTNSRDQKTTVGGKWGSAFPRDKMHGPRFENRNQHIGPYKTDSNALQSSRSLWVGNLSQHVSETILAEQFSRFGEIESINVHASRNYAFINFRKDEDAVIAKRSLQGLVLGGFALKVEFAKGDVPSGHYVEEQSRLRDERHVSEMSSVTIGRDSRIMMSVSEAMDRHKGDTDAEPSEVLWIGFPSFMKVDEMSLRREFAPFGEIEHVKTFPGRTYAFVQFRNVVSACRAKEALQGKLFNNPRVNICFSKSEFGPVEHSRNLGNGLLPLAHTSPPRHGAMGAKLAENMKQERSHGMIQDQVGIQSPGVVSHSERLLSGPHRNLVDKPINAIQGSNIIGRYDDIRGTGLGSDLSVPKDMSKFSSSSPVMEGSPFWSGTTSEKSYGGALLDDVWDSSANEMHNRELKRPRFGGNSTRERSESMHFDQRREIQHFGHPRGYSVSPRPENMKMPRFKMGGDGDVSHQNINSMSDGSRHMARPPHNLERIWNGPSKFEAAVVSSISSNSNAVKTRDVSDESHCPLDQDWKWEGTIAKGGTPICRARCFPVGKVLDVTLPEFLNCTARTGLDMLAKHFYQAGSVGVVFFVPENDPDIAPYKEFMHYLGEKQRAAVAKLGEGTTLFLVPPSSFSEQVLKVPGRVSISGVILKFHQPNTGDGSFTQPSFELNQLSSGHPHAMPHRMHGFTPVHEDNAKSISPISQPWFLEQGRHGLNSEACQSGSPSVSSFQPATHASPGPNVYQSQGESGAHLVSSVDGSMNTNCTNENRLKSSLPQNQGTHPSWSFTHLDRPGYNARLGAMGPIESDLIREHFTPHSNIPSKQEDRSFQQQSFFHSMASELQFPGSDPSHSSCIPQNEHNHKMQHPQVSTPTESQPQPDQLAQLASLLGQASSVQIPATQHVHINQKPMVSASQMSHTSTSISEANAQSLVGTSYGMPLSSQFTYGQQLLQHGSQQASTTHITGPQMNETQAPNNSREETEQDPQKRLQATLQLAAALLQQIQQSSKIGD